MSIYQQNTMVQCFNTDERRNYIRRIEKVKFGVPIGEAFLHDIPATLLVLLLKINKQGPIKKDIWRAPGNQAHVRKLIQVMQHGRLINIDNYSVYTAASVIKKFLCKVPNGILGADNEDKLFEILNYDDADKQREAFCRIVASLPVPSQHLLVLLFGTFRLIADAAETCGTRMTPEAIGVSVAPSLFHSCIHEGQRAKIEDVVRFRSASKMVSVIVQNFGFTNLFPRENYEFYARITGRTLRVDENWRFTFQYPARALSHHDIMLKTDEEEEHKQSFRKISKSVDVVVVADVPSTSHDMQRLDYLAESTKSLSYLEWVHENQTQRMQNRSACFLIYYNDTSLVNEQFGSFGNSSVRLGMTDFHMFLKPSNNKCNVERSNSKRRTFRYHYLRPKHVSAPMSTLKLCEPIYTSVSLEEVPTSNETIDNEPCHLSSHI